MALDQWKECDDPRLLGLDMAENWYKNFVGVERCISSMQAGTQMVNLRGGSKGLVRFYYLDEHKSCICWQPSWKNEKAKSCFLTVACSESSVCAGGSQGFHTLTLHDCNHCVLTPRTLI